MKKVLLAGILIGMQIQLKAQLLLLSDTLTPRQLVEHVLSAPEMTISNVKFNGSIELADEVQASLSYFNAAFTDFFIDEGIILATGNTQAALGPNEGTGDFDHTGITEFTFDADLEDLSDQDLMNQAFVEFDFVATTSSFLFECVYASEEYHEFSTSDFNDVFGFFISGPGYSGSYTYGAGNYAKVPGTTLDICTNYINNGTADTGPCQNCAYLQYLPDEINLAYDGYTTVLPINLTVITGEVYHVKIGVADAIDPMHDSGVFFRAGQPFCNETSSNIDVSTCESYTVPSGSDTYYESGVFNDTILNSSGCDSVITINLTINELISDVSLTGYALLSLDDEADSYQWLDCENDFELIPSATSQLFEPETDGVYAVKVTRDTCSIISDCIAVMGLSINEANTTKSVEIFPNPTTGFFQIKLPTNDLIQTAQVIDASGKRVHQLDNVGSNQANFDLHLAKGIYFVQIMSAQHFYQEKIIVN